MTTPTPTPQVMGALVPQSRQAALLSHLLVRAAEDLWDAACCEDVGQMWEEAREAASRVLAACSRAGD